MAWKEWQDWLIAKTSDIKQVYNDSQLTLSPESSLIRSNLSCSSFTWCTFSLVKSFKYWLVVFYGSLSNVTWKKFWSLTGSLTEEVDILPLNTSNTSSSKYLVRYDSRAFTIPIQEVLRLARPTKHLVQSETVALGTTLSNFYWIYQGPSYDICMVILAFQGFDDASSSTAPRNTSSISSCTSATLHSTALFLHTTAKCPVFWQHLHLALAAGHCFPWCFGNDIYSRCRRPRFSHTPAYQQPYQQPYQRPPAPSLTL